MTSNEANLSLPNPDDIDVGLGKLLIDLQEDLDDDSIDEEIAESDEVDPHHLEEVQHFERRLAESTYWIAATSNLADANLMPVTIDTFFRLLQGEKESTESTTLPIPNGIVIVTGHGDLIPCRFEQSAIDSKQWRLFAEWPDHRRPFHLSFLEVPDPRRPTSRVILHRSSKTTASSPQSSQSRERFLMALHSPTDTVDETVSPISSGYEIILSESEQEIVIATRRQPDDHRCLPVLIQVAADQQHQRRLVILEWVASHQKFIGSMPVAANLSHEVSLRCEVSELKWNDLPTLPPFQIWQAMSGRRQLAIPLVSNGNSLDFLWDDYLTAFRKELPQAVLGFRIVNSNSDGSAING